MVESSYYRAPSDGRKGNRASKLTYHKVNGYVDQTNSNKCCKRDFKP